MRAWIPPQHGVWAMLLLPYLAGLQYGTTWLDAPLLVVWLAGWLASYYALLAVKTRRWRKVRTQVVTYSAVAGSAAVPLFLSRPELLWFSPAFAILLAVNAVASGIGQERATLNGLASVTMASLMAMIVPATAGESARLGGEAALVCWLYLAGSVFYVKTMIREFGSRPHRIISVAFHVLALLGVVAVAPWLALPFAWFLLRAAVLPSRRLRVPIVGAIEVINSLVLLTLLIALL